MGYSKADLELAFKNEGGDFATFVAELDGRKAEEKARKKAEKEAAAAEAASMFDYEEDYDSTTFEFTDQDDFNDKLESFLDEGNYDHTQCYIDYDKGVPDGGVDYDRLVKVNDKFYHVEVNSGAEWIGEWSMRKNVAGDATINKLFLITEYEEVGNGIKIIKKIQVK